MRDEELGKLIRDYFSDEVAKVSEHSRTVRAPVNAESGDSSPNTGPTKPGRPWRGYLIAAALLVACPLSMVVGRRSHEPLSLAVQVQWDLAWRVEVHHFISSAGGLMSPAGSLQEDE